MTAPDCAELKALLPSSLIALLGRMSQDYGYPLGDMALDLGLTDQAVRSMVRAMKTWGWAKRHPFFCEDDNYIRGSGYSLTPEGAAAASGLPALLALAEQSPADNARIGELERERDHLMHVIDRDRYVVAHGVNAIVSAVRACTWGLEGRGPYEWDDDDYRKEFGLALNDIGGAVEPLRKVAWDKSDCTRIQERVIAAKEAAGDLIKQPIGPREMIDADLFGHPREKRIAELEAALTLAANRLDRLAVNSIASGDPHSIEHGEWVEQARHALGDPS